MKENMLKIAVAVPCQLGESPVWDDRQNCLHFVDINGAQIYSYFPEDKSVKVTAVAEPVGAIIPTYEGDFLAALSSGIYRISLPHGEPKIFATLEAETADNRFNDGKADSSGRLWIASMHLNEAPEKGALYMVYPDGTYKKVLDGTTISNGLDWNESDDFFYHVESADAAVRRFTYEKLHGGIRDKQEVFRFAEEEGVPDGMTIDSEGMIWVAHFGGGCVTRRNPETGEELARVVVPVKQVTSCVFGGKKGNDLYITTAAKELSEEELAEQPQAGYTFVLEGLPYEGVKPNRFGNSSAD